MKLPKLMFSLAFLAALFLFGIYVALRLGMFREEFRIITVHNLQQDTVCFFVRSDSNLCDVMPIVRFDLELTDAFDEKGNIKIFRPEGFTPSHDFCKLSIRDTVPSGRTPAHGRPLYLFQLKYEDVLTREWIDLCSSYDDSKTITLSIDTLEKLDWFLTVKSKFH